MSNAIRIILTLCCTAFVLILDGSTENRLQNQFSSCHYPGITGRITASEVQSRRSSRHGASYSPYVCYTYQVNRQIFFGTRLRYTELYSSSYNAALKSVEVFPVGSIQAIYYNPDNPGDSLLCSGISGLDFLGVLFLTPFNMLMLGLWVWLSAWLRERLFKPPGGGVKIVSDGPLTRVRLPQCSAIYWGLGTAGVLGFVFMVVINLEPDLLGPVSYVLLAIGLAYLAGATVCAFLWLKQQSGVYDLVIDESGRKLSLPPTFGRVERLDVDLAAVKNIRVEKVEHRGSKGGVTYTYAPTLLLPQFVSEDQKLADWSDKLRADDFTKWFSGKFGVPVDGQLEG